MELNKENVEKVCRKQNSCKTCPLLITKFVEDDPVYDYHTRIVCYKQLFEKIEEIENYLKKSED